MDDKSESMGRFRREVEEVLALARSAPKAPLPAAGNPGSTLIENSEESRREQARREWILEELRGRLESQARELESERDARAGEVRRLEELRGELRGLQEKSAAAAEESGAAQARALALAETVSDLRLTLAGWEARGREHSAEAARLQGRVQELESAVRAQEAAGAASVAALAQAAIEAERRGTELEAERGAREGEVRRLEDLRGELRALREKTEAAAQETGAAQARARALAETVSDLRLARAQWEALGREHSAETARLQGRVQELESAVRTQEAAGAASAQAAIEAERRAREEDGRRLEELRGELRALLEKSAAAAQEAGGAQARALALAETVSDLRLALAQWEARGRERSAEAARLQGRVVELESAVRTQEEACAAAAAASAQAVIEAERRRAESADLRLQLNMRQEEARAMGAEVSRLKAEIISALEATRAVQERAAASAAASEAERLEWRRREADAAGALGTEGVIDKIKRILGQK